ncbi:hypothetical protein HMH01_01390 [Halovulum dunhuangense]|uniref:LPS-assembly lipoprotein n=1 Tax=Halovulum dunhuangense TaxID=1505036 RepID=A0A849KQF6_9RHOB|nr:LPS assembly lipoprotein LptE [Halovulum dunhuangense]NNU79079.1 hypothetical protein [Halovulum dunhuangense]
MWWSERRRLILAAAALPVLAGCGFTPLYGEGTDARDLMGRIAVDPIGTDAFGFALRQALIDRLGPPSAAPYRLSVDTSFEEDERAIRSDRSVTRFNLTATARFAVTDSRTGTRATEGIERAAAAYSATASPFATRAAEEDARARIAASLATQIARRLLATAGTWAE